MTHNNGMMTVFPDRHRTKNNKIMRTVTKESLRRRLVRLESALESEKARLRKVCGDISWGAGMRRTRCTPSFRREDELIEKIRAVRQQLSQISEDVDNHTLKKSR